MQAPKGTRPPNESDPIFRRPWATFAVCSIIIVVALFHSGCEPDKVLFANDGPLGVEKAAYARMPDSFKGIWQDLNSIGSTGSARPPNLTSAIRLLSGPVGFFKIYVPLAMLFLGFSAWLFFRKLGLSPVACLLGGLAATLNSAFFSAACWGVGPQALSFAFSFLALAAVVDETAGHFWRKTILAGFAIGLAVMEGFDVGALFSLLVAAFVLVHAWVRSTEPPLKRIVRGVSRLAVIAVCAGFIATPVLIDLVTVQIKGIVGTAQDPESKAAAWDGATQWSLPKRETLGLFVPGLFGYRMDTPLGLSDSFIGLPLNKSFQGGNYWGAVGRHPVWDKYFTEKLDAGEILQIAFPGAPELNSVQQIQSEGKIVLPSLGELNVAGATPAQLQERIAQSFSSQPATKDVTVKVVAPQAMMRFSGGGSYEGVLVGLIVFWAAVQSLRGKNSVFPADQRKLLWFWLAIAVVALLLAFGRHAPFFRFFYALPGVSFSRNPTKFLGWFNWAILISFAYGIHGLSRRYLETATVNAPGAARQKHWWHNATAFDRRWIFGCIGAVVLSMVAWWFYSSSRPSLERYLETVSAGQLDPQTVAAFSIRQVGWFVFLLAASVGSMILILSGALAGKPARWGVILLGFILVLDLARANLPWVLFWNYKEKYELNGPNPIVQFMRDKPYESRVAILPQRILYGLFQIPKQISVLEERLDGLYGIEWLQQLFQYYDVQSLDVVQMPRKPQDLQNYERALNVQSGETLPNLTRQWELSNTRYVLAFTGFLDLLNSRFDPGHQRFRIVRQFNIVLKPGVITPTRYEDFTAEPSTNGNYAVFEFTGALPRASLYANWLTAAHDPAAVDELKAAPPGTVDLGSLEAIGTNDYLTLKKLATPAFDPHRTVLLAESPAAPAPAVIATNQNAGTVEYSSYSPIDIVLKAKVETPAILLLNDRYDPNWQVRVDGKPAALLRCNYIMRGVHLTPGNHTVEFSYRWPVRPRIVTLVAIALGLVVLGSLIRSRNRRGEKHPAGSSRPP